MNLRHRLEELGQVEEGAVADLGWVVEDAGQMGAGREVEAEEVADEVSFLQRRGPILSLYRALLAWRRGKEADNALLKLLACHSRRVAVQNLEAEQEHVAQQGVGETAHPLVGPPLEVP